jgi:hypothetical protein
MIGSTQFFILGRQEMFLFKIILGVALLFFISAQTYAADGDFKPGDVIGPQNWQRVQGMVGENLLNRIESGYTFKIKESHPRRFSKEYVAATDKYSGKVTLGSRGELVNYVAGLPFPNLGPSSSQAGLKLAWDFAKRWLGDDFKEGGGTPSGKASSYTIEKDGSERRSEVIRYQIQTRGRVTLDPLHSIPGYDHVDWIILRADEYPRDTSGTTTLETRYLDPDHDDDLYVYVPSIRRVRRAPPTQRCATLAPGEFNYDDISSFNGKITNFDYKFLGERQILGNFSQQQTPFHRKPGDYLPLDEAWEVTKAYVLEITPKDSSYCYPRKLLYIDTSTFQAVWGQIFDAKGSLWKEQMNFYAPIKLVDGQEVISIKTPVIVNVQNGRTTVLNTIRAYNQGYQPTFFTLATLQTVMRGGSLR